MKKKQKPYWEMTTAELAKATKQFDDPTRDVRAVKPPAAEAAKLRRWQQRRSAERAKLTLSLEQELIERADEYAAGRGITFSELVSDALKQLMGKKSA